jgi:hypothetical protein
MSGPRRPSWRESRANWRGFEAPFGTKLRMLLRNNWTKVRTRSNCCGRDGEPGC